MLRVSFVSLVLLMAAQTVAPVPARALDADVVPVPILSARVTRVLAISPLNPACDTDLDVTLTPDAPSVSIDIGCTFVTVSIEGDKIVATREPPGSSDFSVELPEIVVGVPESSEPYLPLVVTHMPGFSSRLRPIGEDGELYASGTSHPTCDCTYTFPAISGERLTFVGGRFSSGADRYEYLVVSARVPSASFPDMDGDGVADTSDACPDTDPDVAVDLSGCSHSQFCGQFVIQSWFDGLACMRADWMDDEPLPWPWDCRVSFESGRCVSQ